MSKKKIITNIQKKADSIIGATAEVDTQHQSTKRVTEKTNKKTAHGSPTLLSRARVVAII